MVTFLVLSNILQTHWDMGQYLAASSKMELLVQCGSSRDPIVYKVKKQHQQQKKHLKASWVEWGTLKFQGCKKETRRNTCWMCKPSAPLLCACIPPEDGIFCSCSSFFPLHTWTGWSFLHSICPLCTHGPAATSSMPQSSWEHPSQWSCSSGDCMCSAPSARVKFEAWSLVHEDQSSLHWQL